MKKSLSLRNFQNETTDGFELTPNESLKIVTPEIYENALKHFLNSWKKSLSQQSGPNESEHVAHISALEKAIADPQLFEQGVAMTIKISRLPYGVSEMLIDPFKGSTHVIHYGNFEMPYLFKV